MYKKTHLISILIIIAFHISILTFTDIKFFEEDEVTFYFAAQNFSQGKWTITEEEYQKQRILARENEAVYNRGNFTQYRAREDGLWVLEKPAGYPLMLSIFHRLKVPKILNIILYIALVLSCFIIKNDFFSNNERFCISVLVASCPLVLISSSRFYMVDFFSFATSSIAFILFFAVMDTRKNKLYASLLAFMSGMFMSASSFSRITSYANVLLIFMFIFLFVNRIKLRRLILYFLSFSAGLMVFLVPNAIYNFKVLQGLFQNPYYIGDMPLKIPIYSFSFQYFLYGQPPNPIFYIFRNLLTSPQIIMLSMPAILIMFPGIIEFGKNKDKRVLLLMLFLFLSIFALFLQFYRVSTVNYLWNARPYLQGFFAVAVFSGTYIASLEKRSMIIMLITLLCVGYCMFFEFLYNNHQDPYNLGIVELWHKDQSTGRMH